MPPAITPPATTPDISSILARSIHDHWKVYLGEGIVLSLLGLAGVCLSSLAGIATTVLVGWLMLMAGLAGLLFSYGARRAAGFGWAMVSAILAMIAGLILLWNPLQGLITLTYLLIAFFVIDGIVTICLAIDHRRELSGRWEWMLVNGIVDLVLAGIIIAGMPGSLAWALGLLVGIDLLFGGASLIGMALQARATAPR